VQKPLTFCVCKKRFAFLFLRSFLNNNADICIQSQIKIEKLNFTAFSVFVHLFSADRARRHVHTGELKTIKGRKFTENIKANYISFYLTLLLSIMVRSHSARHQMTTLEARYRWLRHAPFPENILPRPLGFPTTNLCTKFEVPSSSSFEDMFKRMPNLGATWPATPLWGKLFKQQSAFHMRISYWPNLKSVAQIIFKIFEIVCHKFLPVTWPRPRPFWRKLLARPLGFSKRKLCTKFEYSSWSNFENMFDCMPKILGVTWPRPRPFWGKLLAHPIGFSKWKLCTKFKVSSSSGFDVRLYAKNFMGHLT